MTDFSAVGPSLGYFYQSRYSLYLLLNNFSEYSHISIEKFDDVAFDNNGTPAELLQLKHHTSSTATLTDSSSDLWRTIRVWSSAITNGELNPSEVLFTLITTATAPEGSIASKLRSYSSLQDRDEEGALELLKNVAQTSQSASNKKFYEEFLKLTADELHFFIKNIQVLDSSPNINDVTTHIHKLLQYTVRDKHLEPLFQRLEGWWFQKIISHLSAESSSPSNLISCKEVKSVLFDFVDKFHNDDLPIDFPNPLNEEEYELPPNTDAFIKQLELIMLSETRIHKAMSDYYRAYYQRSSWLDEGLIFHDELSSYEKKLIDEWERYFEIMKEDLEDAYLTEPKKVRAGKDLFNLIDQQCNLFIRPRCTEPYVIRGSYHMLSNQLRVGWHLDFYEKLKHLILIAGESV
jgi:hypothetical protein